MAEFASNRFSYAFDDETSYGVQPAAPSWNAMVSSRPEFSMGRDVEDLNLSVESDFSIRPRAVGSRHGGTFTITVPIRSQLSTYDDPAEALTQNPELLLIEDLMGARASGANVLADVIAGSTAVLINGTAMAPAPGSYIYTATTTAQAVTSSGWVVSVAAFAATLFEDAFGLAVATNDVYGSNVYFSDDSQPVSKTFFFRGALTEHGLYVHGCVPTGGTLTVINGKIVSIDFNYMFDGWTYDTSVGAGLLAQTEYVRLPPIMGVNGGRLTIDGASTGAADPTGTCGIGELSIEITAETRSTPCHGGPQGHSGIQILDRNMSVSFEKPWEGSDIVSGQSIWDTSLEDGTAFSLMIQTGITVGQIFSFFAPQMVITEQPQIADSNGAQVWQLVASPVTGYDGDSGSTAPADTSARIAIG